MSQAKLTAKDLANQSDIGESTVRLWTNQFNIPTYKKKNKLFYSEDALHTLELIKSMKNQNCGVDTIQRKLAPSNEPMMDGPEVNHFMYGAHDSDIEDDSNDIEEFQTALESRMTYAEATKAMETVVNSAMAAALEKQSQELRALYDKLTEQALELGGIREKNFTLQTQNEFLHEQLQTLPQPIEVERREVKIQAQDEKINDLLETNKAKEAEIERLRLELEAEKKRSWWDRLIGK